MFPRHHVHAVTNGVHPNRWTSAPFQRLYDLNLPGWDDEPELLVRADSIPDMDIENAHAEAKRALMERVRQASGLVLDPSLPILGFARRMTEYKRPSLLFADLERLRAVAAKWPFQVVIAGKAHPRDGGGKHEIERIHRYMREIAGVIRIAFLPNYDLSTAQTLVAGADVWLNTPLRPLEASGTSGMKAAFNGVPHLSVLDGWWAEGCIEGVTGCAIGGASDSDNHNDPEALLTKLHDTVLPLFYASGPTARPWVALMKGTICKTASYFNSHRMMRRYAVEAYDR
jgi:starch phosphorylase